ncbi:hypothetical protein OGW13_11490 [Citrobacter sp. Ca225]|uniref:hypothetical protein n=1 Tax=Citrobacter sp. Ca225 TaxID=2985002 RepID=UPI002579D5E4|nr:hypothetical protein [Citrobacter sp. Ca225]MDM3520555.1 hypothetical protein [Citrobacter sp. Ca225]
MEKPKPVFCQVALSPRANDKVEAFKDKLKESGVKMTKSEVIDMIIAEVNMADFARYSKRAMATSKAAQRIIELYNTTDMTEEDRDILLAGLEHSNTQEPKP